jgi:hypothetical protein
MKHSFFAMVIVAACALAACKDTTSPAPTTPTYKYSFTGKISNPKNITIPDDAYLTVLWAISAGSPDYSYYYGEGYIDKATNTFTLGFNDNLPDAATNHSKQDDSGLGVGYVMLFTSPSKYIGRDTSNGDFPPGVKFWGAMDWSGMIYIGGEPSKVGWRPWGKDFKSGYNYAVGVDNPSGFDSYAPADVKDMTLLIDTSLTAFKFPNWTGSKPDKNPIK